MATCQIVQFQDAQNDNQIQVAGAYNGIENVTYTTATSSWSGSSPTQRCISTSPEQPRQRTAFACLPTPSSTSA
jgi:hypothetical protein